MSIFQTMLDDLEKYPEDYLSIEITNIGTDEDVVNEGEVGSFQVFAANTGPLHMTDRKFRVAGLNGTKVREITGLDYVTSLTTGTIERAKAHGGNKPSLVGIFLFEAPSTDSDGEEIELVEVTLDVWDANFDHIMLAHSDPNRAVRGSWSTEVHPD